MKRSVASALALFDEGELAPMPEKGATEALAIYNAIAGGAGWPPARFLTASRRTALRRATKDYGGLTGFKTHLEAASHNDFLTGKTYRDDKHRNWKPDLDWFLKPANVLKLLEEKFPANTGAHTPPQASAPAETEAEKWGRWLRGYNPGRFWPSSQGCRPEDPACRAPADLLKWWREQHKVVVAVPERETKAERLRGMVASYRRPAIGKWERANELEIELAAIEERPAVLVAAPDVAGLTGAGSDRRSHKETRVKPMVFDVAPESIADQERAKRIEFEKQHEPPPYTDVPECEAADAYPDD